MPGAGKRRREFGPRLDDYLERQLASLRSYSEAVDDAVEEFGCSERTACAAIARVRARWAAAELSTLEDRRAKFRAELEHAWKEALVAGDYRAIAVMARTRADIEGIKAPKKIEHGGVLNLRPVAAMSPQEREREIQILLAKRAATGSIEGSGALQLEPPAPAVADVELVPDIRPTPEPEPKPKKAKASKPRAKNRVH